MTKLIEHADNERNIKDLVYLEHRFSRAVKEGRSQTEAFEQVRKITSKFASLKEFKMELKKHSIKE